LLTVTPTLPLFSVCIANTGLTALSGVCIADKGVTGADKIMLTIPPPPVHFHVCIANTGLSWGYPTYVLQIKDLARTRRSGPLIPDTYALALSR
jgi:hypothetical protein